MYAVDSLTVKHINLNIHNYCVHSTQYERYLIANLLTSSLRLICQKNIVWTQLIVVLLQIQLSQIMVSQSKEYLFWFMIELYICQALWVLKLVKMPKYMAKFWQVLLI